MAPKLTNSNNSLHIIDSRTSKEYDIPIRNNTISAADLGEIRASQANGSLTKDAGRLLIFDNGLQNTAIKKSQISSRDPETGMPTYRGYSLTKLTEMGADFEDLFHLLVLGSYPSPEEREFLRSSLANEMLNVPNVVSEVIRAFPRTSPPMSMVLAGLSAYMSTYPHGIPAMKGTYIFHSNPRLADKAVIKTTAAYAVILSMTACHRKNIPFTSAQPAKTFFENLFHMMGSAASSKTQPDLSIIIDVFRRGAIYNADNGMTHSTFIMLAAASAFPDPVSCLISATAAAYGPLHYGAQEATWNNLQEIGNKENVRGFLDKVKRKERRLFGYGHRAFAVEDPRLAPVKGWLQELNVNVNTEPLMEIADEIDRVAAKDEYFLKRGLSANADFYTVFFFIGVGFEPSMVAVANMAHRILGLMAHWREAMDQEIKIFRPLHIYDGPSKGEYGRSRSKL